MTYDPVAHGALCHLCPMQGRTVVPPQDAPSGQRKLVIVGEGPGYREVFLKQPFVGASGQLLDRTLRENKFRREDAYVTNASLCRKESDAEDDLGAICCAPRLLSELAELDPTLPILALGKTAARSILGTKTIFVARGFVWTAKTIEDAAIKSANRALEKEPTGPRKIALMQKALILIGRQKLAGRVVVPTIHPAFVLRSETWMPVMKADFRRVVRLVNGELTVDALADRGKYVVVTKNDDVRRELSKMATTVSFDIETSGDYPAITVLCVGVADRKRVVVIHPWEPRRHVPIFNEFIRGTLRPSSRGSRHDAKGNPRPSTSGAVPSNVKSNAALFYKEPRHEHAVKPARRHKARDGSPRSA